MKLGLGFRVCGFKIGGDGGEMVESLRLARLSADLRWPSFYDA